MALMIFLLLGCGCGAALVALWRYRITRRGRARNHRPSRYFSVDMTTPKPPVEPPA